MDSGSAVYLAFQNPQETNSATLKTEVVRSFETSEQRKCTTWRKNKKGDLRLKNTGREKP